MKKTAPQPQLYIKFKGKYLEYFLDEFDSETWKITVPSLDFKTYYPKEIFQEFLAEFDDILENFLELKKEEKQSKETVCRFRVTRDEKKRIDKLAMKKGFKNTSEFLRKLVLNA